MRKERGGRKKDCCDGIRTHTFLLTREMLYHWATQQCYHLMRSWFTYLVSRDWREKHFFNLCILRCSSQRSSSLQPLQSSSTSAFGLLLHCTCQGRLMTTTLSLLELFPSQVFFEHWFLGLGRRLSVRISIVLYKIYNRSPELLVVLHHSTILQSDEIPYYADMFPLLQFPFLVKTDQGWTQTNKVSIFPSFSHLSC